MQKIEVDLHISGQPAQSASEYAKSLEEEPEAHIYKHMQDTKPNTCKGAVTFNV
jgi:hypothetical protein